MKSLFAEDAFTSPSPSLDFVCRETDPLKGAPQIRALVVREGRGKVTWAMKEWAVMGFYELAAYATLRGRCCPEARPIVTPDPPGSCPRLDAALTAIAAVSRPGTSDDDVGAAMAGFDRAIRCITRSGEAKRFGGYAPPRGGEGTAFGKTLARARKR